MNEIRAEASHQFGLQSQPGGQEKASRASGMFKSSEVKPLNVSSMLADAAEELTFSHSESTEKEVSKRSIEDGRKADSLERVFQVSEIKELLKSLGDLDKRALFRGLKALLKQQSKDPEDLRRRGKEQFKEPSHQYAALKMMAEALKARGASEGQLEVVEKAISGLMNDHGPAIQAALNIGETAKQYANDDTSVADLRAAYTENVHDYKTTSDVLNDLCKRFGEGKLQDAVGFMLCALAQDLEAAGSSINKSHLQVIMADMQRLKTLVTMHSHCELLVKNAKRLGAKPSYCADRLLRELARLKDAPRPQKKQITVLPETAGLTEHEGQIRFLNDLQQIVRLIPSAAFSKPESREKLVEAINDALIEKSDEEMELEEEEL